MGNEESKQAKKEPKTDESCFFTLETNQEQQHRIKIINATPSILQNAFRLQSPPTVLKDAHGESIIHIEGSTWSSKLVKNSLYKVHQHAEASDSFTKKMEIPSALESWDIHCAIICSQAAQLCGFKEDESKREEIRKVFEEFNVEKQFDAICPSIYGEARYILARSKKDDVLYIAFGGDDFSSMMAHRTNVDMEFLKDGEEDHPRQIKGDCNKYVWKQSKSISVELILETSLKSKIKKVVVCGHGVGGAIANVFALRLQLRFNLLKAKNEKSSLPQLVCITFGASRCLSKVIAEEVGHLDNFFNIINTEDPVPVVLDQSAGVANPPGYIKEASKKEIADTFQDILKRMTRVFTGKVSALEDFDMTQKIEELKEFCKKKKITFQDIIKCPFYPLGWYIFCSYHEEGVRPKIGGSNYDAPFDMLDAKRGEGMMQFDNWCVCFIKNADLATKWLAKPKIQESAVSVHLINSYFKMVSQSITRDHLASSPTEHNELEVGTAQSSRPSCGIINLFPPKADEIQLTKRSIPRWIRMFITEERLEIVIKGENLGFFTLCGSNFSRLPLAKDSQPVIKHICDKRIELVGDFDAKKCISDQPSVDVATHFGITRVHTDKKEIKEIDAKTLSNTFVDGLSPLLLLRAWQRGISSVILTESASRESEIDDNKLLSQLYKLEQNSLKSGLEAHLKDYSRNAAAKGFRVLGDPDPELLEILIGIAESLSDELVIDFSFVGSVLSFLFGSFLALHLSSVLCRLADIKRAEVLLRAVTNPTKHSLRVLRKEAYKLLFRVTGRPFFTKIEDDYSSILCTFIGALRDMNDQRQVFVDTMATIYELEEALTKKYKDLGYVGKDPKAILEEKPFKENHIVAEALKSSQCNILRRIQLSCDMFQLRQRLKEDCYIGIVGPQDAGKSTLIKRVWGLDVGVIGYKEHTDKPHVFQIPGAKKLKVVDFPGSTSIDEYMAKVIQTCGGMASFLILVMPYVGDVSRIHLAEFENTEGFQLPTLVCINKCAMVFSHSEDFQSKISVDEARERYANKLKVDMKDVFLTEFLECSPEMKAKGIAGIAEVKKWMETKLTELEFYMKNDDELNTALNRRHTCSK